jgi:hypothetical protein
MKSWAKLSQDKRYRYALGRDWSDALPRVLFIGLNPSTADASTDDPTIKRCIGFARSWGFGGIAVGNLFAYRSTHPSELRREVDPVGPLNDAWLIRLIADSDLIVAAWGNGGRLRDRDREVVKLVPNAQCLGVNRGGTPTHPLYVGREVKLRNLAV